MRIQQVMKRGSAADIDRQLIHDNLNNACGVLAPN